MCCNSISKETHINGSTSTADDFQSRLELEVTKKICFKNREDIQTTPFVVASSSLDVADEELFFFRQADVKKKPKEKNVKVRKNLGEKSSKWVVNEDLSPIKPNNKEFTKIDRNTTIFSINGSQTNARIRVEQDDDLFLRKIKLLISDEPHQ